ncbi:MAG: hypothetical protein U9M96_01785 [Thermodesulfobacteriota bacterium]|nr:hypothetical protein [Thermodesulfobacteriota bacterium]
MMNGIDFWQIMKWVLIVLVAGFIGQFGKTLAKHLMEKAKAKKGEAPSGAEKTEVIVEKIGGKDLSPKIPEDMPPEQAEERAKQEKKALKALAKQKKKEAKLTEKQTE